MVDRVQFDRAWKFLCKRFNREPDAEESTMYREWLSERLTTEEFLEAARHLWANWDGFRFPAPAEFVKAAKGGSAESAADDWLHCRQVMAGNVKALQRMTEAGKKTVLLMGGVDRLRNTPIDEVHFRRAEFLRLHPSAQEIHRLERGEDPGRRLEPGERKVIEASVPRLMGGER